MQNVARAYTAGPGEKKVYTRDLPLCTKCNYHHTGQCAPKCGKCKRYGHATTDCRANTNNNNNNNNKNQKVGGCYECGNTGHMRRDFPKLKNHRNGNGNGTAQGELMLWEEEMLAQTLTSSRHHAYHLVIEKIVQVPFKREMLIFQGNGNNQKKESRLNIISCTKEQEYMSKGCDVFLAHITTKEVEDKSEEKRLEDVPIVRDFPEVFPEDLPGQDPSEEHESEDEEAKEDEHFEDSDETEPIEEDETFATPPSPRCRGARITVRPQPHMTASTQALIDAFAAGSPSFPSPPPINPTYDQAPLGMAAMIRMRDDIPEEDMPPRRRFILTAPSPSFNIAESSAAAAARASRVADRAEDVGYVRALQDSKRRMMTSIEEVNLRVSYQVQARKRESEDFHTQLLNARTDHRDVRLEVDVVRGQRTAYEIEL
ncbi:putative reverse transcriptase domain-containing protein [Tanacetum coccineum]